MDQVPDDSLCMILMEQASPLQEIQWDLAHVLCEVRSSTDMQKSIKGVISPMDMFCN